MLTVARGLVAAAVLCSATTFAMPEKPFRMNTGAALAFQPGSPNGYGIGAVFEPKVAVTEQFHIGLRVDAGVLVAIAIDTGGGTNVSAGLNVLTATLPKLEFQFTSGDVRPFVGAAGGLYWVVGLTGGTSGAGVLAGRYWGVVPQLGIDLGGFRLAGLYHVIFGVPAGYNSSYFALELSGRSFLF